MTTVFEEQGRLVDDTAKGAGVWTMVCTAFGSYLAAPQYTEIILWLIGIVITGLFGVASSAVAVVIRLSWEDRRRRKGLKSANESKGT